MASTSSVTVDFAAPVAEVYEYFVDPTRRPEWQSSLRRVEDVEGDGGVGTTWLDVTSVGVRPRMTTTVADPGLAWAETGTWRGIGADLRLDFQPLAAGTRVVATFELRTPRTLAPLGFVLRRLAPLGVRSDLRRAARQVGSAA
jgi:uncharacterized protein YndB with AHSA1/START domain